MTNRKDDHIEQALKQSVQANDFDKVRFAPHPLARLNADVIDLSVRALGRVFPHPLYINAMTGGSDRAKEINRKLALLANACDLPMACGSQSVAIKDKTREADFQIIREAHPNGFLFANVGLSQSVEGANRAVAMIQANALQIHLNAAQEITMPEGDRDFSNWPNRLKDILSSSDVPVVVKEVGFGMSREGMLELASLGVTTIDVSGRGGTNFIAVENARRTSAFRDFETYGFSTVESLLEAKGLPLTIFASGGVRGPFDVVKALALGATMVGVSKQFLELVESKPLEEAILQVKQWLKDIRGVMAVLGCPTIESLQSIDYLLDSSLINFVDQRGRF
jgi:isopentenyl-diphosphate Delta-isomerase